MIWESIAGPSSQEDDSFPLFHVVSRRSRIQIGWSSYSIATEAEIRIMQASLAIFDVDPKTRQPFDFSQKQF
jgi:hypothetical protein